MDTGGCVEEMDFVDVADDVTQFWPLSLHSRNDL